MASTSPEHPHLRSRLESLPDVVLRKLLCHVAAVGRVALIQLARASPIIYKPAVTVAIQTAPADWHPVSVMTMGNFQVGRVLWRKTDVKDAVGRLVYAKAKSPLLYLVWADFLCDHPQRYFEVFGPIPPSQQNGINSEAIVTPPDRPRPFAAAYLYTYTALQRESVFDLVVPHHEFFHGVSNWLTGGPSNSDCLSMRQAKGMGEGWSDMFALAVDMLDNPTVTRDSATPFAPYVMGNPAGMRTFPYTSDLTVNPSRYSFQGTEQYRDVHKFVEVWASMLWEVYWNLVDKYGCGPLERANLTDGNAL